MIFNYSKTTTNYIMHVHLHYLRNYKPIYHRIWTLL